MADNMNVTVRDPLVPRRQMPQIVIGRAGEYGATTVTFDLRGFIDRYGAGVPTLLHKRPPDDEAYIVPLSAADTETHDRTEMPDSETLVWHVGQVATSYVGNGTIELQWRLPGTAKKTAQFDVVVLGAIGNPVSEIPNAQQIYLDVMQGIADDAEDAANRAEAAVEHYPQIVNGVWFVWDAEQSEFVSTGISAQGEDGISPTVTVTAIEGGHRVTITDATGAHQFDVMDGEDGTGGSSDAVLYTEQDLTDAQKQQARANIGAGTYSKPNGGIPDSDIAPGVIPDVSDKQNAPLEIPITTNDGGESYTTTVTAAQIRAAKENAVFVFDMFRIDAAAWLPDFFDTNNDVLVGVLDADFRIHIMVYLSNDSVSVAVQMSQQQSIPTKVSELTNDSGYQTAQDVQTAIASVRQLPAVTASDNGEFLRVVNGAWTAQAADSAPVQSVNGKTGSVMLDASDVGALPDDTPIPAAVTEQTVANWGFTKNTGTYSKPSGGIPDSDIASAATWNSKGTYSKPSTGIPKSDLASDVKTSLGKADTALQQHQSLAAYRTSAAQDRIDAGKLDTTGNAYRSASIPMGHLDATSTATVMTATVDGITELRNGVCMWLQNGVITSASGFTLNVNGLGAKPCYSSLAAESRSTTIFNVNYALLMIYNSTRVDGGCWDIVYGVDTNTTYTPPKLGFGYGTCTTAAATTAKTASISSYALTTGGIVAIKFDNAVPAGATLNISSKGAKAMHYRGAAITAGVIKAGDVATFIYSTYYHLISIDRWGADIADLGSRLDTLTVLDEEVF